MKGGLRDTMVKVVKSVNFTIVHALKHRHLNLYSRSKKHITMIHQSIHKLDGSGRLSHLVNGVTKKSRFEEELIDLQHNY